MTHSEAWCQVYFAVFFRFGSFSSADAGFRHGKSQKKRKLFVNAGRYVIDKIEMPIDVA